MSKVTGCMHFSLTKCLLLRLLNWCFWFGRNQQVCYDVICLGCSAGLPRVKHRQMQWWRPPWVGRLKVCCWKAGWASVNDTLWRRTFVTTRPLSPVPLLLSPSLSTSLSLYELIHVIFKLSTDCCWRTQVASRWLAVTWIEPSLTN